MRAILSVAHPIRCGAGVRTTEMKPWLPVGAGSMERHARMSGRHLSSRSPGGELLGMHVLRMGHESSTNTWLRAVDFSQGVEVLEGGSTDMTMVVGVAGMSATDTASAVSTATTAKVVERGVFSSKL